MPAFLVFVYPVCLFVIRYIYLLSCNSIFPICVFVFAFRSFLTVCLFVIRYVVCYVYVLCFYFSILVCFYILIVYIMCSLCFSLCFLLYLFFVILILVTVFPILLFVWWCKVRHNFHKGIISSSNVLGNLIFIQQNLCQNNKIWRFDKK